MIQFRKKINDFRRFTHWNKKRSFVLWRILCKCVVYLLNNFLKTCFHILYFTEEDDISILNVPFFIPVCHWSPSIYSFAVCEIIYSSTLKQLQLAPHLPFNHWNHPKIITTFCLSQPMAPFYNFLINCLSLTFLKTKKSK
jgi:hypothetical protein